jgi:hypothetical protein
MVTEANRSQTYSGLWLVVFLFLSAFALAIFAKFSLVIAFALSLSAIGLLVMAVSIVKNSGAQKVLLSLATFAFCFAVGDIGAWWLNWSGVQTTDTLEFSMNDPVLGFRPVPGQRANAREVNGDQVIFDVSYTINASGMRETPGPETAPCHVVIFGDSLTFGWGLPDHETLAAQFVSAANGRYKAYNFAFPGYGPHQMLRSLETGRVERVLANEPVDLVIYQGIMAHLSRAAGRVSWDLRGPRYVTAGGGEARYTGPFHGAAYAFARKILNKSQIVTYLNNRSADDEDEVRNEDVPLFVAILKQAQSEVDRRFGPGRFMVLFSDDQDALGEEIKTQLADAGVHVLPTEQVIPDIFENSGRYELSPLDRHPNAAFNRLVGDFLAKNAGPQRCRPGADLTKGINQSIGTQADEPVPVENQAPKQ